MIHLLSVGINQYDPGVYGSASLRYCVDDSENIQLLFDRTQLTWLVDQDATREAVRAYIARKCYPTTHNRFEPGDVFVWFQSSHGTYWPTSAKSRKSGRCMYDGILWDSEVAKLLAKVPDYVRIITISDCCFSEDFDRSVAPRFMAYMASKYTPVPQSAIKPVTSRTKIAAPLISISSSRIDQVSYETSGGGNFTRSLVNTVLQERKPIRRMIDQVYLAMKTEFPSMPQVPTVRYNAAARLLMNTYLPAI